MPTELGYQNCTLRIQRNIRNFHFSLNFLTKQLNLRNMAVGEQNSLGSGKNMPECSKQNISKRIVCSPKKESSFSGLPEYFQTCLDMFQIYPDNFKQGVVARLPLPPTTMLQNNYFIILVLFLYLIRLKKAFKSKTGNRKKSNAKITA